MPRNPMDDYELYNAGMEDEEAPQEEMPSNDMGAFNAGQDYSLYANPSEVQDDTGVAPEDFEDPQSLAQLNGVGSEEMQMSQPETPSGAQELPEMLAEQTQQSESDIADLIRDELLRRRQERRLRSEDFQTKAAQMNADIIKSLKR